MTDVTLGCSMPAGVAESADARVSKPHASPRAAASPLFAADPAATPSPAADNGLRAADGDHLTGPGYGHAAHGYAARVANSVATPPLVAGGQGRDQEEICDSAASILVTTMVALVVAVVLCALAARS